MDKHRKYNNFNPQDLDALFYIVTFQSAHRAFPSAEAVCEAIGDSAAVDGLIATGYLQQQGTSLVPVQDRIWQALRCQRRRRRVRRPHCLIV